MQLKIFKILRRVILLLSTTFLLISLATLLYLRQDKFGKAPDSKRKDEFRLLSNYYDNQFQNINPAPEFTDGQTMIGALKEHLLGKYPNKFPNSSLPNIHNDLTKIPLDQNILVWFGHSSYYLQIDKKRVLVDPVFSNNASPISGTNKSFEGTNSYSVEELPYIDYVFISHDHYDHLDYETMMKLKNKVGKIICGLGIGSHLHQWGYPDNKITELNWNDHTILEDNLVAYCLPAKHFSGRALEKNNTLWASFLLQFSSQKIYIGGDSGYDTHFAKIGEKFKKIDLALLDNGQYDKAWQHMHMLPEEVLKASKDLNALKVLPGHSSKFAMSNHPWNEPLKKITELNKIYNVPLITPVIGEIVYLNHNNIKSNEWWVDH